MIVIQQIRRFFLTVSLAVILSTIMAFGFGTADSWAVTSSTQRISLPPTQVAAMNQVEAMTRNIEGKAQEAIGKMTGDPKDQMMGKAKQVESQNRNVEQAASQARNAAAEMKDKMQLKEKAKAVTKNIEGKVNAVRGQ